MNCREYTQSLQSFVDTDLDASQFGEMEAHGRSCYACAEALAETQQLFQLLDDLERDPAPPEIIENVLSRLSSDCHAPAQVSRISRRSGAARFLDLAALLAPATAVSILLLLGSSLVSPSHWTTRLGTLATWWAVWVGDLVRSLTWLHTSSLAEIEQAMGALLRAGGLLLEAAAVPVLACWSLATMIGLGLARHTRVTNSSLRRS